MVIRAVSSTSPSQKPGVDTSPTKSNSISGRWPPQKKVEGVELGEEEPVKSFPQVKQPSKGGAIKQQPEKQAIEVVVTEASQKPAVSRIYQIQEQLVKSSLDNAEPQHRNAKNDSRKGAPPTSEQLGEGASKVKQPRSGHLEAPVDDDGRVVLDPSWKRLQMMAATDSEPSDAITSCEERPTRVCLPLKAHAHPHDEKAASSLVIGESEPLNQLVENAVMGPKFMAAMPQTKDRQQGESSSKLLEKRNDDLKHRLQMNLARKSPKPKVKKRYGGLSTLIRMLADELTEEEDLVEVCKKIATLCTVGPHRSTLVQEALLHEGKWLCPVATRLVWHLQRLRLLHSNDCLNS